MMRQEILDWFRQNPKPTDEQVHAWAATLGRTPEDLEREIFSLFTDCVRKGCVDFAALTTARTESAGLRRVLSSAMRRIKAKLLTTRDTDRIPNQLLRHLRKYLGPIPKPPKVGSNADGITYTFVPENAKYTAEQIVEALHNLPDYCRGEKNDSSLYTELDHPFGFTYTEEIKVIANDDEPESKAFTLVVSRS